MIKMGLFLFVVAAIAGILLAATESFTAPKIEANKKMILEKARLEVLPTAKAFKEVELEVPGSDGKTEKVNIYAGFDSANKIAGIVVSESPKGYGGPIEMVLGMDLNGKISGVKILSQKETPGLGTKLAEPSFLNPFMKLIESKPQPNFRVKQDSGDVDAITAATISSRAFCSGIRQGNALFETVKEKLQTIQPPVAKTEAQPQGEVK